MKLYHKNELTLIDSNIGNESKKIELLLNGERIARRVYFNSQCGLYIRINNRAIFSYDFNNSDTITIDEYGIPIED